MSWEIILSIFLILAALISFIWEKIPPDLTAIYTFLAILLVSSFSHSPHWPSQDDLLLIFSNNGVISVAAMFILSASLEKTGAIDIFSNLLSKFVKFGHQGIMLALVIGAGAISCFINNTPVVVILMPAVLAVSKKANIPASKFLIPLSYASIFGGCCTVIGTSTNLLVNGLLQKNGYTPFSMFEFAPVGVPIWILSALYLAFWGYKILPERDTVTSLLSEDERKEYLTEAFVYPNSPLIGSSLKNSRLLDTKGLRVLEIIRDSFTIESKLEDVILQQGDRLLLACKPTAMAHTKNLQGFSFPDNLSSGLEPITLQEGAVTEGVLLPWSSLIGKSIQNANFHQAYRLVLLAIHRKGVNLRNQLHNLKFQVGDMLLLLGSKPAIEKTRQSNDILLLDKPPLPTGNMKKKRFLSITILLSVILVSTLDFIPIAQASLIGIGLCFLFKCIDIKEAYNLVDWRILFMIYGTLALGSCMDKSGLSSLLASSLINTSSLYLPTNILPYAILLALILWTSLITEILSNNASAVLMTSIALNLGSQLHLDPKPFVLAIMIAASASFSTPIGYQTNTYVYGVGGYKFSDFFKIGARINLIYAIGTFLLICYFFPFIPK